MADVKTKLRSYFPIESQTSDSDKEFLLAAIAMMGGHSHYTYVEIGSFLGGSLAPFLMDPKCRRVLSIDERERQQADERGAKFDYAGFTHQGMTANLQACGIHTDKLQTFDGSVDAMPLPAEPFDLAFIDGEHTDNACFRDFLWLFPMMKQNSLVMFHDSTLVYKALQHIQLYLKRLTVPHVFAKKQSSEMSALFFGALQDGQVRAPFGQMEDVGLFYAAAEKTMLYHQIKNRVEFDHVIRINEPKVISILPATRQ